MLLEHDDLVVKDFVLLLHTSHEGIFREVVWPTTVLLVRTLHLFLQGLNARWQQPVKFEDLTFLVGKRGTLIMVRRSQ